MEAAGAAEPGIAGYIPNFVGANQAAEQLAALPVWHQAGVIKVVPNRAQLSVRIRALEAGKLVYMAAPKLATERLFYQLDPSILPVPPTRQRNLVSRHRSHHWSTFQKCLPIDLVVFGGVAVNQHETRLGKGAGYADLEIALLVEADLITIVAQRGRQSIFD